MSVEYIASVAFETVMREILTVTLDNVTIDSKYGSSSSSVSSSSSSSSSAAATPSEHPSNRQNLLFTAAARVLRTLAKGAARHILVPYFCRILTVHCGVRAKLLAQNALLSQRYAYLLLFM